MKFSKHFTSSSCPCRLENLAFAIAIPLLAGTLSSAFSFQGMRFFLSFPLLLSLRPAGSFPLCGPFGTHFSLSQIYHPSLLIWLFRCSRFHRERHCRCRLWQIFHKSIALRLLGHWNLCRSRNASPGCIHMTWRCIRIYMSHIGMGVIVRSMGVVMRRMRRMRIIMGTVIPRSMRTMGYMGSVIRG